MNNLKITQFFPIFLIAGLSACSTAPSIQEFPDTASPRDEVTRFDADLTAAIAAQVNVLAPSSFGEAENSLKAAKKSLDRQSESRDSKQTLHEVAVGRAWLNRSQEFARLAHANIEDVIVARNDALSANAPRLFGDDFKSADDSLRDVTSDIEKNNISSAKENRAALQLRYLDLELRSIKQTQLGQARETIKQATKEGAKEYAPRSLSQAEKSVQDADAYITANRHDSGQLAIKSGEARKSADHLLKITRTSKGGKKLTSEEAALQMENEQNKVAEKQVQIDDKNVQIENKDDQLHVKSVQIAHKDGAIEDLKAENSGLENEQAFNRRFEEARQEFLKGEAEVYKQGNTLVVRLRGLEFPTSQAVLKGSNFPLLAKVQKVIRSFGSTSVVVEGHTDSNGGKELNERLSSERAEAVKQYLASNNTDGPPMEIKAIGYGYQKPLSTNKTPNGRAQNRRVDVLIHPETM